MKTIKKLLKTTLNHTPFISDIYQYYWLFPRTPNSFRGVFQTFSEAEQAIPAQFRCGYNLPELHQHDFASSEDLIGLADKLPADLKLNAVQVAGLDQPIQFGCHPLFKFRQNDYPLLLWLKDALKNNSRVFDLGGGIGLGYYTYEFYLSYPPDLRWMICDVPEAIKAGEKIAKRLNLSALAFTTEFADADGSDILLTCGTLQYLEPALADRLKTLRVKPHHLLINRVPFHDSFQYVTVQNLCSTHVPYKIQNCLQFIRSILNLGYELVDFWNDQRTCTIPFHPECFVSGYYGFYFRYLR